MSLLNTKTDVDLVDLFEEGLLLKEVVTTGEMLLCKSERALLHLNQRVFSFSEDYEPTYRLMLKQSLFMQYEHCFASKQSLQRCITRIEAKTPSQLELFRSDIDAQDILILNLKERLTDICAILIQKPAETSRHNAGSL